MSLPSLTLTSFGSNLKWGCAETPKTLETEIVFGLSAAGLAASAGIVLHALSVAF